VSLKVVENGTIRKLV